MNKDDEIKALEKEVEELKAIIHNLKTYARYYIKSKEELKKIEEEFLKLNFNSQ